MQVRLPRVTSLGSGESVRFEFLRGRAPEEGFLLRLGDDYVAYANSCPHWNVDLDLGTAGFYEQSLGRILCRNHGALFHPLTGVCEWGPCVGRALERFSVALEGDDAVVTIAAAPP